MYTSTTGIGAAVRAAQVTTASTKHVNQQVSIVANMHSVGLLRADNTILELGCGRAMLSLALADELPSLKQCVLVDRAPVRRKADTQFARRGASMKHVRIKCDIADIDLRRVPELVRGKVTVVSKHLCGGATDLALRAIRVASTAPATAAADSSVPAAHVQVDGVAIATCCHHRCTWDQYVAKEWFLSLVRV